jgi:hypothetical protein
MIMRKNMRDVVLAVLASIALAGAVFLVALGAQAAAPGDKSRGFTPEVRAALLSMVNQECTGRSTYRDDTRVTACDAVVGDAVDVTPADWELMYDDKTDTWFWNHKDPADMKAWH